MPFKLKPYKLNIPSKDQSSSTIENKPLLFSEEIQKCCERIFSNEKTQFNLGETRLTSDPTEAADFLIHREYGSVFDGEITKAVFIPPVFLSKQYEKDIPTLYGDVDEIIDENYDHLQKHHQTHWLTYQLREFLQNGEKKNIQGWISKMKLLYLINSSLVQSGKEFVPPWKDSRGSLVEFTKKCIAHLNEQNPGHELIKDIQQSNTTTNKKMSAWLTEKVRSSFTDTNVEINPPMITLVLKYLFSLKYSEVVGEQAERLLFEHLNQSKDMLSDFVIMHSLKIFTSPSSNGNHKEYDFLLLSAERKLIIAIEVKQNKSQKNEAKKQLEKSKRMFEEKLGEQLDREWSFYPVVFVNEHFENIQEPSHVVTSQTIGNWLSGLITHRYPKRSQETNEEEDVAQTSVEFESLGEGVEVARNQLQDVIKILVFCLHINRSPTPSTVAPGPLTTSKWVQWLHEVIDTISTTDTILFYSKEQLAILHSGHPKIIIDGGYGTGKSILLREKAQMLARQGEKVLFFVHPCKPKSLLQVSLEEMFLKVDCYKKNIVVDKYMNLLDRMREHKDAHIFIDELRVGGKYDASDIIDRVIEERKESNKCLWIVFHRYYVGNKMYHNFKTSDTLTRCFRSSCDVYVDYRASTLHLKNSYSTRKPVIVADINSAVRVALEEGYLFREVEIEREKGICHGILYYITGYSNQANTLYECYSKLSEECLNQKISISIKAYSQNCRDLETLEPKQYLQHLRERNSILVVDSQHVIEGFEWPIVIIDKTYNPSWQQQYIANECFRSMVTFIAIVPPEYAKNGFKEEEAVNMSYYRWE